MVEPLLLLVLICSGNCLLTLSVIFINLLCFRLYFLNYSTESMISKSSLGLWVCISFSRTFSAFMM